MSTTLFDAFRCRSFCELGELDKCTDTDTIYERLDSDLSIGLRPYESN